jgi:hypothetical protein
MESFTTRKALLDQPTCTFGAPDGKRFKGWAMSKADADAGTVIRRLVVTQDVELFAVWTDENNILISTAFSNFKDDNKTARNFFVGLNSLRRHIAGSEKRAFFRQGVIR